jgi:hypothetical protein
MSINDTLQDITETLDTFPIKWLLSSYSEEELELLGNTIEPYHIPYLSYPYTIKMTPIEIFLDRYTLEGAVSILKRPLEEIPLLINDYTDERMAVVKWRLMIGR